MQNYIEHIEAEIETIENALLRVKNMVADMKEDDIESEIPKEWSPFNQQTHSQAVQMLADGWCTAKQLAEALGLKRSSIMTLLTHIRKDNKVMTKGRRLRKHSHYSYRIEA